MRCHVCDKTLSEAEIQVSPSGVGYEPCTTCLDIAFDAAYCNGFQKEESAEEIQTLDPDIHLSSVDELDSWVFQEDPYE